jgi:hypothetical protein
METNYEEVKDSLLSFGKKHSACQYEYKRLYAAESVEAVMAVVKDNFSWCCQFYDFADVLLAYRDQFAEHKIWINTSVEIKEGVGCLLTTEGEFNARSWGTSTINAESRETSTMIIPTSAIECQVNDKSIARYIQDNRVVFADDSIKFEKQG